MDHQMAHCLCGPPNCYTVFMDQQIGTLSLCVLKWHSLGEPQNGTLRPFTFDTTSTRITIKTLTKIKPTVSGISLNIT